MRDFNFIKNLFINKHENIDNIKYLDKYLIFLLNYNTCNDNEYNEKHHILPTSVFPEYKNEIWNIIKITYEDHKLVHLWLFKAINIRKYQRPLNWMLKEYKNSNEISKAAKMGWITLKKNDIKYKEFCKKRSDYMKNNSKELQSKRSKKFWDNITDEKYLNYCNKMKKMWTNEMRHKQSISSKKYYSNIENREKMSKSVKNSWDNMDKEKKQKFKEKMVIVNKNIEKRKKAGNTIKQLWKDKTYLEKMINRKHRSGKSIKIIKPDKTELIFETMTKLEKELKFSSHLIRKYRNTNKKIQRIDLNYNNLYLLDCIIETL